MSDNASFEYEDNFFQEYDEIQTHLLVRGVGLTTLIANIVIFCFGVPANIYMLYRLWKVAKEDREKYENGTGSGLFVMAIADLFSLIAISLQHVLPSVIISSPEMVKSLSCKILIFVTHTMTSVSIWSWLLMSTLRYLAIRHPCVYFRLWRTPYRAIALIVFLSTLTNAWLFLAVSNGTTSCMQHTLTVGGISQDEDASRWLHLIECIWSYCLPVGAILYMDTMVFLCCSQQSLMSMDERNEAVQVHGVTMQANRALWTWLIIAFINIVLNTPENLYRLLTLLDIEVITPDPYYYYSFRMIAQVLYYAQFAFNAVYLPLFIFDKSIRPLAPQPSTESLALIEMGLISTQGFSSIKQYRRNQYRPLISVMEP